MQNLLKETINFLGQSGKTTKDVLFVGDGVFHTDWDGFAEVANFEYDNGYGGNQISSKIKVFGDGWWLERWEYDGSEGWVYREDILRGERMKLNSVFEYNWDDTVMWGEA